MKMRLASTETTDRERRAQGGRRFFSPETSLFEPIFATEFEVGAGLMGVMRGVYQTAELAESFIWRKKRRATRSSTQTDKLKSEYTERGEIAWAGVERIDAIS